MEPSKGKGNPGLPVEPTCCLDHKSGQIPVECLVEKIGIFLRGRTAAALRSTLNATFEKFADVQTRLIMHNRLKDAMGELGKHVNEDEAATIFTSMDTDNNGGLDFDEFSAAMGQPSTQAEQFLNTLPLSGMLASSLLRPESFDPLKQLSNITKEELTTAIKAFSRSLNQVMLEELEKLKELVTAMEGKAREAADGSGTKFAVSIMNADSTKDYL